jgi:hypothetical protein
MADRPRVRPAVDDDRPAIAAIADACGLEPNESGRDPHYVSHLMAAGSLVVAVSADDTPIAYGATVPIGTATMLADLFVDPRRREGGAGAAILSAVLAGHWMTFSSKDPRAMALYRRHGATPRWPLLYLTVDPASVSQLPGTRVAVTAAGGAAGVERELTGIDRSDAYHYWTARPAGEAFVVYHNESIIAAGCRGGTDDAYGLTHLVAAPAADGTAAVLAAIADLDAPAHLCVPGAHPVASILLSAGARITDFDTFHSTGPDPTGTGVVVAASGLC